MNSTPLLDEYKVYCSVSAKSSIPSVMAKYPYSIIYQGEEDVIIAISTVGSTDSKGLNSHQALLQDLSSDKAISELELHFHVEYENQCNLEFSDAWLSVLPETNTHFTISCYERGIRDRLASRGINCRQLHDVKKKMLKKFGGRSDGLWIGSNPDIGLDHDNVFLCVPGIPNNAPTGLLSTSFLKIYCTVSSGERIPHAITSQPYALGYQGEAERVYIIRDSLPAGERKQFVDPYRCRQLFRDLNSDKDVTEISLHYHVEYGGQCNLEFSPTWISTLSQEKIYFTISCMLTQE